MAGKVKFDQESAFKSIIGVGRQSENTAIAEEKNAKKRKIVTGCSGPIIWIGTLIRRCAGWHWRKIRI